MFLVAWEWTNTAIAAASISTFIVLAGALIFARKQIRTIRDSRATEILGEHLKRWGEEWLAEARSRVFRFVVKPDGARMLWDTIEKARKEEERHKEFFMYVRIPEFFEEIGIMCLKSKSVPPKLVYEFFAFPIAAYWRTYEPWIRNYRRQEKDNRVYEWFEKLAEAMRKITIRRHIAPP